MEIKERERIIGALFDATKVYVQLDVKTYRSKVGGENHCALTTEHCAKDSCDERKTKVDKMQKCNHAGCRISRVMQTGFQKKESLRNELFVHRNLPVLVVNHVLSHIHDIFGIVEER